MAFMGLEILGLVVLIILLFVFIALPLYLTARFLDEDEGLLKALGTTLLLIISFSALVYFIPVCLGVIIAIIVNLLIIKLVYETTWGKALVMWIVTIVMFIVITVVVVGLLVGVGALFGSI